LDKLLDDFVGDWGRRLMKNYLLLDALIPLYWPRGSTVYGEGSRFL